MRFHKYYFYLLFIISRESASCFFHNIHSFSCLYIRFIWATNTREFLPFYAILTISTLPRATMWPPTHNASGWFSFHSFSCPQWKFLWLFIVLLVALHSFFPASLKSHFPFLWTSALERRCVSTTLFHVPFFLLSLVFLCGHWKGAREVSMTRYRKWYLIKTFLPYAVTLMLTLLWSRWWWWWYDTM